MGIVIDGSKIAGPALVDEGEYTVVFAEYTKRKTSTGKDMITGVYIIQDDDNDAFNGQKLFDNWVIDPNSLWVLKRAMIAFDCDPELFDGSFDLEEELDKLKGNTAVVAVAHESYTNRAGDNATRAAIQTVRQSDM